MEKAKMGSSSRRQLRTEWAQERAIGAALKNELSASQRLNNKLTTKVKVLEAALKVAVKNRKKEKNAPEKDGSEPEVLASSGKPQVDEVCQEMSAGGIIEEVTVLQEVQADVGAQQMVWESDEEDIKFPVITKEIAIIASNCVPLEYHNSQEEDIECIELD